MIIPCLNDGQYSCLIHKISSDKHAAITESRDTWYDLIRDDSDDSDETEDRPVKVNASDFAVWANQQNNQKTR